MTLPKDLDLGDAPETRHLEFEELMKAVTELSNVLEEFQKLTGDWTSEEISISIEDNRVKVSKRDARNVAT